MKFTFLLPVKIIFGTDSIENLGNEIKKIGNKTLLVYGKTSASVTGVLEKVKNILSRENIKIVEFSGISTEPTTEIVDLGREILRKEKCDNVIGLGGGSVIDSAKAIAGLAKENFPAEEYLEIDGFRSIKTSGVPFVAIPTISGTGAEVTMNSVLVNLKTKSKRSIRNELLFAKLAVIDPKLSTTVPLKYTFISAIDALCHIVEGFISKKKNQLFNKNFVKEGIKLVLDGLKGIKYSLENIFSRTNIALASLYGGVMIVNSGLTLSHGIGSVIGPMFNIPHGLSCFIPFPFVLEHNFPYLTQEEQTLITEMFTTNPVEFFKNLSTEFGISLKLSTYGVKESDIPYIAEKSVNTSSSKGNPIEVKKEDVEKILQKCL